MIQDTKVLIFGFAAIFIVGLLVQLIFHPSSFQSAKQPVYPRLPAKNPDDIEKQQSNIEVTKLSQRVFTLFAIGGTTVDTELGRQHATASVEYYNPQIGTWKEAPPLQIPKSNPAAAVVQNKIYVFGGVDPLFPSSLYSSVEEFDTATKTWTNKSDMPEARQGASAIPLYGKIYIVGGQDTAYHLASRVLIYDTLKDSWSEGRDMPAPNVYVYDRNCSGIGTHIYCPEAGDKGVTLIYDTNSDNWSTAPTDGRSQTSYGKGGEYNGKLYSIVGSPYGNYLSIYDTKADSIKRDITLQKIRFSYAVTSYTSYLFSLGGKWDNDPYTEVYGYNIYGYPQNTWFSLPSMIHPRADAAAVIVPLYFGVDTNGLGSLSGNLRDGSRGAAFVPVYLQTNAANVNNDIARVESDANGNYIFTNIAPGNYSVLVEDPVGSSSFHLLSNSQGQRIELHAGEQLTGLNYTFMSGH